MDKVAIYVDFRNIMSAEYQVDIFQIPNAILDKLFSTVGSDLKISRKYVFIPTPSNESQARFANMMIQDKFDVIAFDYMDKAIDVAITTKLISDAYRGIYDISAIISGNISLYPAIKEVRSIGKQILLCNFSDRINSVYKEPNYETGPLDFDLFYFDDILEVIANKMIDGEITTDIILEEINLEFFDGNIDYNSINMRKYITYWATRARYLQLHRDQMSEEEQEIIRRVFDKLNDLSSQYKPGFIKALDKKWHPQSWEEEIRMIPKVW